MGRNQQNRKKLSVRVDEETPEKLKEIAFKLGFIYDEEGATGELMDAISSGQIILILQKK